MGLPFFDAPSIYRRLDSTICLFDGKPVFIRVPARDIDEPDTRPTRRRPAREGDHLIQAYHLPMPRNTIAPFEIVDYRDERFSYKTLDLGYINAGNAVYLTRTPMRQQRQGLCQSVVYGFPHAPEQSGWFTSEAMKDCLLGIYPSQEEAEKRLRSYTSGRVAISRRVALGLRSDMIELLFKSKFVGYKPKNATGFTLFDTRETPALREILKETVCLK